MVRVFQGTRVLGGAGGASLGSTDACARPAVVTKGTRVLGGAGGASLGSTDGWAAGKCLRRAPFYKMAQNLDLRCVLVPAP